MKKVLITGANGFLGANLTRELYRLNYEVRVLVRPDADISGIADIPCEFFSGNVDNEADVQAAVAGCEIVIHAAAVTDQWGIPFSAYERINFTATKYICNACLLHNVKRLIYVSTANTIGPGSMEEPGTELNGFTLFSANSYYINTKYLAQQYVLEQVAQRGLPAVIVNPTFMVGPNDVKPSSGKLLLYALRRRVLLYPPGGKNFVFINDVCRGIINAIREGTVGDCYLLAGHNISYRDFFRRVNEIEGRSPLLFRIPAFVLKLCGLIGSLKEKITCKANGLNYTNAYLLCLFNYYSGKKAETQLQVKYTGMDEALRITLHWFKDNKYY